MSDPHQVYNKGKLYSVQGFAAKLATRKWSENAAALCRKLSWHHLPPEDSTVNFVCVTLSFLTAPSFPLLFLFLCPQLLIVI